MKKLQNTINAIRSTIAALTDLTATALRTTTHYDESGFGEMTCHTKTIRFIDGRKLTITTCTDPSSIHVEYALTNVLGRKVATSEYHSKDPIWGDQYASVQAWNDFGRNVKYLRAA